MLDTNARKYMQPILDISFVRVVEVSMIVALACINPDARFLLVILAGVIVFTMAQRLYHAYRTLSLDAGPNASGE